MTNLVIHFRGWRFDLPATRQSRSRYEFGFQFVYSGMLNHYGLELPGGVSMKAIHLEIVHRKQEFRLLVRCPEAMLALLP